MSGVRCACGRSLSAAFVALADYCPSCGASPVVESAPLVAVVPPPPEGTVIVPSRVYRNLTPIPGVFNAGLIAHKPENDNVRSLNGNEDLDSTVE